MTDSQCTCPIKSGKRQQCADGQTIKAYNCPVHGVPRQVKREDTCQWTIDEGGSVETQCGRVLTLSAYTPRDFRWCLYCGGDIITGNGTIQPAPGASPSP